MRACRPSCGVNDIWDRRRWRHRELHVLVGSWRKSVRFAPRLVLCGHACSGSLCLRSSPSLITA
eukprot:887279-Alexandrium_andersonii.AAC.1